MRNNHLEDRPACSVKSAPAPMEIKCPGCSTELEIWSDESDVECSSCGLIVRNDNVPAIID